MEGEVWWGRALAHAHLPAQVCAVGVCLQVGLDCPHALHPVLQGTGTWSAHP